jgi:hypothetical protein
MRSGNKITSVYFAEGLIDAWYDHTLNILVIRFFSLNLGSHRAKAFDCYEETVLNFKPRTVIFDTSEARGIHAPSDENFFRNRTFPTIQKINVKNFISIFPKNPIAMVGMKEWLDIGDQFGFKYIKAASLDEAYTIIESGILSEDQ